MEPLHDRENPPEDDEYYESEFAHMFDKFLAAYQQEEPTKAADLLLVILGLMMRLRTELTAAELRSWLIRLSMTAEIRLQAGRAFADQDGNPVNTLLAEEKRELGTDTIEIPDTVPQDWV